MNSNCQTTCHFILKNHHLNDNQTTNHAFMYQELIMKKQKKRRKSRWVDKNFTSSFFLSASEYNNEDQNILFFKKRRLPFEINFFVLFIVEWSLPVVLIYDVKKLTFHVNLNGLILLFYLSHLLSCNSLNELVLNFFVCSIIHRVDE